MGGARSPRGSGLSPTAGERSSRSVAAAARRRRGACSNLRGGRLSRQAAWMVVKKYGTVADRHRTFTARAPPLVRDASARPRCRSARRSGDARSRVHLDHPGVHARQPGTVVGRSTASTRSNAKLSDVPGMAVHSRGGSSPRCRVPCHRHPTRNGPSRGVHARRGRVLAPAPEPRSAPLRAGRAQLRRATTGRDAAAGCWRAVARHRQGRGRPQHPPAGSPPAIGRPHRTACPRPRTHRAMLAANGSDPVTVDLAEEPAPPGPTSKRPTVRWRP